MQNIAKYWRNSSGHITHGDFKTAAIFLFFEVETWFLVCNPILGSCLSVQKELGKTLWKKLFTDSVSVNKKYLTDTLSVNKKYLTDTLSWI